MLKRSCKLCGGQTIYKFSLPLADGLQGEYFECTSCQMLQSYHLDQMSPDDLKVFYRRKQDIDLDPGAAWRQYCVASRIEQLVKLRVIPRSVPGFKVLDYGCGSGFTASWLGSRFGWDILNYDPYGVPAFSPNRFVRDWEAVVRRGPYHLVIASEVFEHLVHPKEQISRIRDILSNNYAFVFITTGLYIPGKRNQEWNYLAPDSGGHVCFYSRRSLAEVGQLLGACGVYQVAAQYESLFVKSSTRLSRVYHAHIFMASVLLRKGVNLGIVRKTE